VHVIPQKSYVCDSYITHKNPYMPDRRWGGDASPHPPPGSATDYTDEQVFVKICVYINQAWAKTTINIY